MVDCRRNVRVRLPYRGRPGGEARCQPGVAVPCVIEKAPCLSSASRLRAHRSVESSFERIQQCTGRLRQADLGHSRTRALASPALPLNPGRARARAAVRGKSRARGTYSNTESLSCVETKTTGRVGLLWGVLVRNSGKRALRLAHRGASHARVLERGVPCAWLHGFGR